MRILLLLAVASLLSVPALAQTDAPAAAQPDVAQPAAPRHVAGTIVSFEGGNLSVKSDAGDMVTVGVPPAAAIVYNESRRFSDIKVGDFLGVAAVTESDGKLHAQEVRIFPESLRGLGEGQYPMGDASPNRSMTNATVAEVVAVSAGGTMTLTFHGAGPPGDPNCSGHAAMDGNGCVGMTDIVVAPGVPVRAYVAGDNSLLVPGAAVSMIVAAASDGSLLATRLLVEHNGVKPN